MSQSTVQKAIFWGALTGLGVLALGYMSSDISRTPFIPAIFLSQPPGSQPDFSAIAWCGVIYLLGGALFGTVLQAVKLRWKTRILPASWVGAGFLFLFILLAGLFTGLGKLLSPGIMVWQAILLLGWGWILSRLVYEMDRPATGEASTENQSRRMTPRQFRYLVIAGALTAIVSALRIFYMRSGN